MASRGIILQEIADLHRWIRENPAQIDGVLEKQARIKYLEETRTSVTAADLMTVDLNKRPALRDYLVTQDCVVLDGQCDCEKNPNGGIPLDCKYGR